MEIPADFIIGVVLIAVCVRMAMSPLRDPDCRACGHGQSLHFDADENGRCECDGIGPRGRSCWDHRFEEMP